MKRSTATTLFVLVCLWATAASAWDGTDTDTGAAVQIEQGNTVRTGNDIQLYDEDAGEYHDVTVENINRLGSTVEVDVYDSDTGESRTLQFDDNDQ